MRHKTDHYKLWNKNPLASHVVWDNTKNMKMKKKYGFKLVHAMRYLTPKPSQKSFQSGKAVGSVALILTQSHYAKQ